MADADSLTALEADVLDILVMSPESTDLLLGMVSVAPCRQELEDALRRLQALGLVSVDEDSGPQIARVDPLAPGANELWWSLTPAGRLLSTDE